MIAAEDLLVRHAGAWVVEADDELVMLDPGSGTYFALDAVGRRVWELLERPRRFGELLEALTTVYAGDPERMRDQTDAFLAALHERGLLEVTGQAGVTA